MGETSGRQILTFHSSSTSFSGVWSSVFDSSSNSMFWGILIIEEPSRSDFSSSVLWRDICLSIIDGLSYTSCAGFTKDVDSQTEFRLGEKAYLHGWPAGQHSQHLGCGRTLTAFGIYNTLLVLIVGALRSGEKYCSVVLPRLTISEYYYMD